MKKKRSESEGKITIQVANEKIADLRKSLVPTESGPEDLNRPIDDQIRETHLPDRYRLELMVEDVAASWTTIVDFQQQIGNGVIRMGGIAGVGTHDEHRFKGYSRRVMESSLYFMRREGFDTAMLYGILSFYPKYGYAEAFPGLNFTLPVRDAELVEPKGYRIVDYSPEFLLPVLKMYHANNAGRSGITRRDPKLWTPFRKGLTYFTKCFAKVLLDERKKPVGYYVYDDVHLTATLIEVGFATMDVFPDILRAVASFALEQRLEKVRFVLPEDDAFIEFCKPLGIQQEVYYRKDGGGMVRMINVPETFKKLSNELTSRMRQPGSLNIRTNLDDINLFWADGQMTVGIPKKGAPTAQMPQWALAQLLYGYRKASALAYEGAVKAGPAVIEILEEMFPLRPHFQYPVDHF